jgi:UDP-glucose 4-epimerase
MVSVAGLNCFVTGGAGFIGSNLVDRLLALGCRVTAYDNFTTGCREFLVSAEQSSDFSLVVGDILDMEALTAAMAASGCDMVMHLAANADVRHGAELPRRDLEQNTIGTSNVLEAMRKGGVRRIVFASTGSIYGEPDVFPTPERAPFPVQTSLYGASKLAAEGLISAYCEAFGVTAWIFRFVSILGERYTHGHIFDFFRALRADPGVLRVLGDGHQKKSYLYVGDCVDAILTAVERTETGVNIFNLGTQEYIEVNDSIACIVGHLGLAPSYAYEGGSRGWVGDSPFIFLDTAKIHALGWEPRLSIREGIARTLAWLQNNSWIYEKRA